MNLAYLFLAEGAIAQGGRLFVYGGGVHYIRAERFPSIFPNLALVASVQLEPEEARGAHLFEVRGLGPNGQEFCPSHATKIEPKREPDFPNLASYHVYTLNIKAAHFPCPGTYEFQVCVDGNELGRVRLVVIQGSPEEPASEYESGS